MPNRTSNTGSELFIVDNSDADWKVLRYLHDWCQISKAIDIATGYFEIGALLGLKDEWQKIDQIRILMGDEVAKRTKAAFTEGLSNIRRRLDASLETEKAKNDFLAGVPAIVEAIRAGTIACRVYRKEKFHAKAYITHARLEVVGSSALVGSSNFTLPGLTENIELNVQITGRPGSVLQEWYEEHWAAAEDVTPEILRTIERHIRDYTPFEVYAKALHELHHREPMSDQEWLREQSKVYRVLDQYQKDGFHRLLEIANAHGGAFLCDGVGLGKTFIGLMLIEYLIEKKRKRVALLVPKAGREPVWEIAIRRYLPHLAGGTFSSLEVLNHTDLQRGGDFPLKLQRVKDMADVILIDEAHNFRNPGYGATGRGFQSTAERAPSRYRQLFEVIDGPHGLKQVFMLTATPINNKLIDLQHMIELFSRKAPDKFRQLGIHSLPGHFRRMEKELNKATAGHSAEIQTDLFEAEEVLTGDVLFRELVVQRSRAYVKESQLQQGSSVAAFPTRDDPNVAGYELKKTYGKLLDLVAQAFAKDKPLFSLAIYYPLAYYQGDDKTIDPIAENRQKQVVGLIRTGFLKRFESSAQSFECSCERLLQKLLAFVEKHTETPAEKKRLERWKLDHKDLIGYVHERQLLLFPEDEEEEADEDIVTEEMLESTRQLSRAEYKVDEMLIETFLDLDQVAKFLDELQKFKPKNDDKLKALIKLLTKDPLLKDRKVLIFSEFSDTARYLKEQLVKEGLDGVEQIDSGTKKNRSTVIRCFAPYYNGSTSAQLAADGLTEIRILISTDVLSEGLNLQDAARLINYDLHWNPVRLMQRIGRVDRRMNPEIEARLVADHPEALSVRWSFPEWPVFSRLESAAAAVLDEFLAKPLGFNYDTHQDDVFNLPLQLARRLKLSWPYLRQCFPANSVRNWSTIGSAWLLSPYSAEWELVPERKNAIFKYLNAFRRSLEGRAVFDGGTYESAGRPWYEFHQLDLIKSRAPFVLVCPEIASHVHVFVGTNKSAWPRTVQVGALRSKTQADLHLLVGLLNSSSSAFWLKQVCFNKGAGEDEERDRFVFSGKKVQNLPVPSIIAELLRRKSDGNEIPKRLSDWSEDCWRNGSQLCSLTACQVFEKSGEAFESWNQSLPDYVSPHLSIGKPFTTAADLQTTIKRVIALRESLRAEMIARQEEMDWLVYAAYGLTDEPAITLADADLSLAREQRPFCLWAAADCVFARAVGLIPADWSEPRKQLWRQRLEIIRDNEHIRRIEQPVYKRRWDEQWKVGNRWVCGQPAYDAEFLDAFEWWLSEKAEWWLEHTHKGKPVAVDAWSAALWSDPRVQAAWTVAAETSQRLAVWKRDQSEKPKGKPPKLDASEAAFAKAFKSLVKEQSVPANIPYAVAWEELEKKMKIPAAVKSLRGKLNVPRERFRVTGDGMYIVASL